LPKNGISEPLLIYKAFSFSIFSMHPKDPNTWGLKNLSKEKWVTTGSNGSVKDVEPERSVTLVSGTKITFGKVDGEIRF